MCCASCGRKDSCPTWVSDTSCGNLAESNLQSAWTRTKQVEVSCWREKVFAGDLGQTQASLGCGQLMRFQHTLPVNSIDKSFPLPCRTLLHLKQPMFPVPFVRFLVSITCVRTAKRLVQTRFPSPLLSGEADPSESSLAQMVQMQGAQLLALEKRCAELEKRLDARRESPTVWLTSTLGSWSFRAT